MKDKTEDQIKHKQVSRDPAKPPPFLVRLRPPKPEHGPAEKYMRKDDKDLEPRGPVNELRHIREL